MKRILLDSGTGYSKLYFVDGGGHIILPNRTLKESLGQYEIVAATGHNASRFSGRVMNELLALAYGGLEMVDKDDFTLVDCGARDIKLVRVQGRRVQEMNWNTECGAFCGQTVELLLGHFGLRSDTIAPSKKPLAVTCGVLGMTQLFDLIAADVSPEEALARFVRGVAENIHRFAGRPDTLYLSGGLCENRLFLDSFDSELIALGRFVLLAGLRAELARTCPPNNSHPLTKPPAMGRDRLLPESPSLVGGPILTCDSVASGPERPRLLLHICCAPCSTHVVEVLRSQFEVTGHFYNPNVHPEDEYRRRAAEMGSYARRIGLPLIVSQYDTGRWREAVRGLEREPEGGRRCLVCYRLRLEETALAALKNGFTHFTTSLSISPHKRADAINAVGLDVAALHGLEFYAADFKKKDGFTNSLRLSREASLYRQDYCGCQFSLEERVKRSGKDTKVETEKH